MSTGEKLKQRRLELGLSQKVLAEKTNLSLKTIQRIEHDRNVPHGYTLRSLADALEMDIETLAVLPDQEDFNPLEKVFFINLSVLSFLVVPFGNLIFPMLAWNRNRLAVEVDQVARQIVNFQITWSIVSYGLLAIAPFLDRFIPTPIPLIFVVLILAYVFNIYTVWQTSQQLKAGNTDVCKHALGFF